MYEVEKQSFEYKDKIDGIEWIVTSNINAIRLYSAQSGDRIRYHEWTLESLATDTEKQKEFYFLLAKGRLFTQQKNVSPAHTLLAANTVEQDTIEKQFYEKYKTLREYAWNAIVKNNADKPYGKNFYLYKVQKLIDRIIFIRFCRENGALDNDAVAEVLNYKAINGKYTRLKLLFTAMDSGNPEIGIAKFNGGLFATDKELDELNVHDDIIDNIVSLYHHDFGSDLSVNILGHIFEQSISDLETLTGNQEKKRKKDGVFYTPAYITEWIVNEAVGGWLRDKKAQIKEKEYTAAYWKAYAADLKSITILDPACGSGAFLVRAYDFLQQEWNEVAKHIKTNYTYKDILANNLYGVDINVASVGITKLSLWLKTANWRAPLTVLDNNIKVGNSLIDDKKIAGFYHEYEGKVVNESITIHSGFWEEADIKKYEDAHKKSLAFEWENEFAPVFANGGFDVVIGNPPYGAALTEEQRTYMQGKYAAVGSTDTAALFVQKAMLLTKNVNKISIIIPKSYCFASNYNKLRQLNKNNLYKVVDCGKVWSEVLLEQVIVCFSKTATNKYVSLIRKQEAFEEIGTIKQSDCDVFNFFINGIANAEIKLAKKIKNQCIMLNDIAKNNRGGILQKYLSTEGDLDAIGGSEIDKWQVKGVKGKINLINLSFFDIRATHTPKKLSYVNDQLNYRIYDNSLLVQNIVSYTNIPYESVRITSCIPQSKKYILIDTINQIVCNVDYDNRFVWLLLNHKLINWYAYRFIFGKAIITMHFDNPTTSRIPIPQISFEAQQPFISAAQTMLTLHAQLHKEGNTFLDLLLADLKVPKITTKLKNWYTLVGSAFIDELKKQKIELSLKQKEAYLQHFAESQKNCSTLQAQLDSTDKQIDQMVYNLYNLTPEEIATVEQG